MKILTLPIAIASALLAAPAVFAAEPLKLPPPPSSGEQWVPGIEYIAIVPSRKTAAPAGKVEVVFRHQYTVSIFRSFEIALARWLKTNPDYIHVVRKPHVHYPHARYQARMFLTLQQMGREELALTKLYDWIWDKQRYPVYHNLYQPDGPAIDRLNLEFVRANGLDEKQFLKIYQSPQMDTQVIDAEADSMWELDTMAMVDGTFATDIGRTAYKDMSKIVAPENFARFFKLIEYLADAAAKSRSDPSRLKALIDEIASKTAPPGTPERRIADMHASFMDTARIDVQGLNPMRDDLQKIAQVKSKAGIASLYGQGNFIYVPFRVDIRPDPVRTGKFAAAISQSGLDMHDTAPYIDMDPKAVQVREKFVVFLGKMLDLNDSRNSQSRAQKILDFETAVAKASKPATQKQDEASQKRTWTLKELLALAPAFDWKAYLKSNGLDENTPLLVGQPEVIRDVAQVIANTDLAVLKDHLTFSIICTWGWYGALPQSIYDLQFDFYGRVRRGATEQPDRKTRAYNMLNRTLKADLDTLGTPAAKEAKDGPEILRDDVYGNAKRSHAWNWKRQRARLQ